MDRWLDHIIGLFTENRDIMRIMFAESVKDGENQQLLFRLSDMIAAGAGEYQQRLSGLGLPQLNLEIVVIKFFGGILPIAYYAVCSDAWAAHYGMTKQALKQGLYSLFHAEHTRILWINNHSGRQSDIAAWEGFIMQELIRGTGIRKVYQTARYRWRRCAESISRFTKGNWS
jgi:hypothetical protein